MVNQAEKIRIIFGLKIKQLRLEKAMSLADLAAKVQFSVSYLNEIEKGKKYPKSDKIMALATAFEVDYDALVSIKVSDEMEPIADILNSGLLSQLPLDMFGIDTADFVDLMSKSPVKISAFINTLKELSRNYDIHNDQFFEAVLRSYQEINENYFDDLEQKAVQVRKKHLLSGLLKLPIEVVEKLITKEYKVKIHYFDPTKEENLAQAHVIWKNNNSIFINKELPLVQKIEYLVLEIAYQNLNFALRPIVLPLLPNQNFGLLMAHFKANYLTQALLMDANVLEERLTYWLATPKWNSQALLSIFELFNVTLNSFVNRLTHILSGAFGIKDMYLFGLEKNMASQKFKAIYEMHLRQLHSPHGFAKNEHYCRRWLGLSIINSIGDSVSILAKSQISHFQASHKHYFVFSLAQKNKFNEQSHTIGFVLDAQLKKQIAFSNDPQLPIMEVNQTCERCGILSCQDRVAEPNVFHEMQQIKSFQQSVNNFIGQ